MTPDRRGEVRWAVGGREVGALEVGAPARLERLAPGGDGWEVEIGFGKGLYLRRRAAAEPNRRFLGLEMVQEYWREVTRKAGRDGMGNLVTIRGEALYVLDALLPEAFADAVHVYFPDPWPKKRHRKRRLFDRRTVDLALRALRPGATLFFATDFVDYGEAVVELLASQPALAVHRREGDWPDGPRTHYERKYEREGRQFVRLEVERRRGILGLHPAGRHDVLVGPRRGDESPAGGDQPEVSGGRGGGDQ